MSDTESDIEDIPHDEVAKKLKVPEFDESPTSSGGEILFKRIYFAPYMSNTRCNCKYYIYIYLHIHHILMC